MYGFFLLIATVQKRKKKNNKSFIWQGKEKSKWPKLLGPIIFLYTCNARIHVAEQFMFLIAFNLLTYDYGHSPRTMIEPNVNIMGIARVQRSGQA